MTTLLMHKKLFIMKMYHSQKYSLLAYGSWCMDHQCRPFVIPSLQLLLCRNYMFLDIEVDICPDLRYFGHFFHAGRRVSKEFELDRKFCYCTKCLITYFRFTLKQIRKVIMFLGNKSIFLLLPMEENIVLNRMLRCLRLDKHA